MTSLPRNHRLIRLGDLTCRHTGRQINVAGLTGTLTAIITVGPRVQLGLRVNGARLWTDWLPVDDTAEIYRQERT